MAIDPIFTTLTSGLNLGGINSNFVEVESQLNDALSRSGTSPNEMNADIDLNGNDLLNVTQINGVDYPPAGTVSEIAAAASAAAAAASADAAQSVSAEVPQVTTYAGLKALDTTSNTTALLKHSSRGGLFAWRTGDQSTEYNKQTVSAVTYEGLWVKADAIAVTSGAWERIYEGEIQGGWFDIEVGGSSDQADNITAMLTIAEGEACVLPSGTINVQSDITNPTDSDIRLRGNNTTIDCDTGTFSSGYVLAATGSATQIENLSVSPSKNDQTVTFASAPSAVAHDWLAIFNPTNSSFSGFQTNYYEGEFIEVDSISGSVATLQNRLYDGYTFGNVDVYKMTGITGYIKGIDFTAGASTGVISVTYGRDMEISGLRVTHADDSCLFLSKCLNMDVHSNNMRNQGDGGNDYALSIGNCQDVYVHDNNFYSRRHGVTIGGGATVVSVVNRNIVVDNNSVKNEKTSLVAALDCHGNAENVKFIGNTVEGGIAMAGLNQHVLNNHVTGGGTAGVAVTGYEILGGVHTYEGNYFETFTDPNGTSRGIIDFGGNSNVLTANTTSDFTLVFKNNTVKNGVCSTLTSALLLPNRGSTNKINVDCQNNTFLLNTALTHVRVRDISGTPATDFLIFDGNITTTPAGVAYGLLTETTFTSSGKLRVQGETYSEAVTVTSGNNNVTGTAQVFNLRFPKTPTVVISRNGATYVGNRVGIPYANPIAATGYTPGIATDDATNFSATLAVTLQAHAHISEV